MPFLNTSDIKPKEPLPGWAGRFFNSTQMTFGYYDTVAGLVLHEHSHPNEEVWHVIDGELEVMISGETKVVGPGCVAMVPPDALHSVRVITSGRVIVADHPVRESIGGATTSD
ncbi:MAG: cupin domain-containing protein [Alphaproteobacteria bacterium]|nr:cupin domain-containing protein [Alphaproteobacteria bacterium]